MKARCTCCALALVLSAPLAAWSQVSISVNIGPPPLLVYEQPTVPGEGYIWTPGYWGWSQRDAEYYWIPGTWVLAPEPGFLWTPGYWAFAGSGYRWNFGYWGPRVGYYGGINYGYGYGGRGYDGGRWNRGVFSYNRSVSNINPALVHNVYNTRVVNNYRVINAPHVSYNGGPGGTAARPGPEQRQVQRATHTDPTPNQVEHERAALTTPTQRASTARSAAPVAATPRPSAFTEPGVVHARSEAAARPAPQRDQRQLPIASARQAAAPSPMESRPAPHNERQAPGRAERAEQPQQPQAERGQPRNQGEGRGRDKQRD